MPRTTSFFRHRDRDSGWTQVFEFNLLDVGRAEIAVYCRMAPKEKHPQYQDMQPNKLKSCQDALRQLVERSGGGIVVTTTQRNEWAEMQIWTSRSNGYSAPSQLLRLSVGLPPAQIEITTSAQRLARGDRLLIPVDLEAETELKAFLGHLSWLSGDVEAVVLDSLTRPSIESRLAKIERERGHGGDGETSIPVALLSKILRKRIQEPPRWLDRAFNLLFVLLTISLLMAAQALLLEYFLQKTLLGHLESRGQAREEPPGGKTMAIPPTGDPLRLALEEFGATLSQFPPESPERAVAQSILPPPSEAALRTESFAYGLVKLLAILHGSTVTADDLKADAYTSAKRLLREIRTKLSSPEKQLLAYVTCAAFPESQGMNKAGIKKFDSGPEKDRVDLDVPCKDAINDQTFAIRGLHAINADLRQRLTP